MVNSASKYGTGYIVYRSHLIPDRIPRLGGTIFSLFIRMISTFAIVYSILVRTDHEDQTKKGSRRNVYLTIWGSPDALNLFIRVLAQECQENF